MSSTDYAGAGVGVLSRDGREVIERMELDADGRQKIEQLLDALVARAEEGGPELTAMQAETPVEAIVLDTTFDALGMPQQNRDALRSILAELMQRAEARSR